MIRSGWIAAEAPRLAAGVFDSIDEAVRFAFWPADSETDTVRVEPDRVTRRDG